MASAALPAVSENMAIMEPILSKAVIGLLTVEFLGAQCLVRQALNIQSISQFFGKRLMHISVAVQEGGNDGKYV